MSALLSQLVSVSTRYRHERVEQINQSAHQTCSAAGSASSANPISGDAADVSHQSGSQAAVCMWFEFTKYSHIHYIADLTCFWFLHFLAWLLEQNESCLKFFTFLVVFFLEEKYFKLKIWDFFFSFLSNHLNGRLTWCSTCAGSEPEVGNHSEMKFFTFSNLISLEFFQLQKFLKIEFEKWKIFASLPVFFIFTIFFSPLAGFLFFLSLYLIVFEIQFNTFSMHVSIHLIGFCCKKDWKLNYWCTTMNMTGQELDKWSRQSIMKPFIVYVRRFSGWLHCLVGLEVWKWRINKSDGLHHRWAWKGCTHRGWTARRRVWGNFGSACVWHQDIKLV